MPMRWKFLAAKEKWSARGGTPLAAQSMQISKQANVGVRYFFHGTFLSVGNS
jgi:hypothetical protein